MSCLLDTLQQQFAANTADITSKVLKLSKEPQGTLPTLLIQVDKHFDDAKETLEQLDLEIRSLPLPERSVQAKHLSGFQKELSRLKSDYNDAKVRRRDGGDDDMVRVELFDGDDRSNLLNESERVDDTQTTPKLGAKILSNLTSQRSTVTRSREPLRRGNYDLSRSSRIASVVLRRIKQSKLLFFAICAVGALVVLIIFYKHVLSSSD